MSITKLLTLAAVAASFVASSALAESCCEKAKAAGKECAHKCCVEATKGVKVCEKCNPKK